MKTLNKIARLITFPGAYIRSFWARVFASILEIPVQRTGFLSVILGRTRWLTLGMYCLCAGFVCLLTGVPLFVFGFLVLGPWGAVPTDGGLPLFLTALAALCFGAPLAANLYPSLTDAKKLWAFAKRSKSAAAKILGYPFALWMLAGAYFESTGLAALVYMGGPAAYLLQYLCGRV